MNKSLTEDIAYFIAFCIESYKNAYRLSGIEVSEIFSEHGIFDFLEENYEVLHTQCPARILEEITDVINE